MREIGAEEFWQRIRVAILGFIIPIMVLIAVHSFVSGQIGLGFFATANVVFEAIVLAMNIVYQ